MLRAAAAATLLLLSGCLAAGAPATPDALPGAKPDDGLVVTATRVEPLLHWVDAHDAFQALVCQGPGDHCGSTIGLETYPRVQDFGDPAALFWRIALRAESEPQGNPGTGATGLRMEVSATKPCGAGCVQERPIAFDETRGHTGFDALDVYLQPGETGVRVRLVPLGQPEAYVGGNRLEYHLHGAVGGFRAVAEPVVL